MLFWKVEQRVSSHIAGLNPGCFLFDTKQEWAHLWGPVCGQSPPWSHKLEVRYRAGLLLLRLHIFQENNSNHQQKNSSRTQKAECLWGSPGWGFVHPKVCKRFVFFTHIQMYTFSMKSK